MHQKGIIVEGLIKSFDPTGPHALDTISAHIAPGRITGVVGPDGAGKTTLLRLMAGLLLPSQGRILINGKDATKDAQEIHETLGYMPQKFGLYEDLSVLENLTLHAKLKNVPNSELKNTFDAFLKFTRLEPFQDRLAGKLSGGMKQKLGLACSLLQQPKVLLLDEPSVGVDPLSRRDLWAMVKAFTGGGTTVVWSTSYLDEAQLCDEVLVLNEGHLLFTGTPDELSNKLVGRIFQTTGFVENKRRVLQSLLQDEGVMDGLIQGDGVRLVLNPNMTPEKLSKHQTELKWEKVKPNFEDGFMDLLGGIKERTSPLADLVDPLPNTHKEVIVVNNVTKKFGDFMAVKNVSFEIPQGEIFGFLGPNGAGKSTTFKMLCGLLVPTKGHALVLGHDLRTAASLARRKIGYMAQKFSLYGNLTVKQNLDFFSGIYGLYGAHQMKEINAMIDAFNLESYLNVPADTLPLGYKQRLALACAVMHRPSILFLDEPTSGVDPLTRREFWMHINGMVQKGVTVMVTTHFLEEAEYCDRACLIYRGQLIALGSPDDLKKQVQGDTNILPSLEETFIELIQAHDRQNPISD